MVERFFPPFFPPLKPRYVLSSGASYSPKIMVYCHCLSWAFPDQSLRQGFGFGGVGGKVYLQGDPRKHPERSEADEEVKGPIQEHC